MLYWNNEVDSSNLNIASQNENFQRYFSTVEMSFLVTGKNVENSSQHTVFKFFKFIPFFFESTLFFFAKNCYNNVHVLNKISFCILIIYKNFTCIDSH